MGHALNLLEFDSIAQTEPSEIVCKQSPSENTKYRRILSCASRHWSECVQAVICQLPSSYREEWIKCLEQVLHGDGPLPISWRIYIAILALCRHELTWVVRALTFEYVAWDGDKKWLFGVRFAPAKIRALVQINKILANRPWLVTPQHIADLTKGDESWSLSELCQALCILAHFHSMSSFLHSCLPKQPSSMSSRQSCNSLPLTPTKTSPIKQVHASSLPNGFRQYLDFMPKFDTDLGHEECMYKDSKYKVSSESFGHDHTTQNKENEPTVGSKRELKFSSQPNKQSKNEDSSVRCVSFEDQIHVSRSFQHLCSEASYRYEEFPSNATNAVLRVREYNWEDHGFCLVNRLLTDMGKVLDNRFRAISTLNKHMTPSFRQALWNHVQSLYGIYHDDYDYCEIGKILGHQLEVFVKNCCCLPNSLAKTNPTSIIDRHVNMVPICVVIMDAKLQTELLFALRAVAPHQC